MIESKFLIILAVLFGGWLVYLWWRIRKSDEYKPSTEIQYLWRLKEITGKSEYEIFQLAAEEKGWPEHQVESHFNQYIQDQTLPIYVKEFLTDGKEHIAAYRPERGGVYDKKLMVFYVALGLVLIGGAILISLWVFPKI